MKVALVWRDYEAKIGGGATVLRYITQGFERRGVDYDLLTYRNTWHIPIRFSFLANIKLWTFSHAASRKLDRGNYDWCLCQALNGYAGILSNVVTITRHAGALVHALYDRVYKDNMPKRGELYFKPRLWMEKQIYTKSEGVICSTPSMKKEIEEYFGRRHNVFAVGKAVDVSLFNQVSVDKPPHPRILYVGRRQRLGRKGVKYLIEAFELVKKQCPEAELYMPSMSGWIPLEEMPRVYHSSTIFAYPTLYDDLANVVLEAMACRLPCVLTDIGTGYVDIIRSGQNALMVPMRDPVAMADAILTLIHDPKLRKKLGDNAYRTVKDMTPERFVENILRVAEKLTG